MLFVPTLIYSTKIVEEPDFITPKYKETHNRSYQLWVSLYSNSILFTQKSYSNLIPHQELYLSEWDWQS